jgi:hypothetical protein
MKRGNLLLALFLIASQLLAQQTGTVSGKVVNSVTGEAVKKAVVTLRSANGESPFVAGSDQSGKFVFDNVPPATYIASAQAEGYSNTGSSGKPIAVAAGQAVEDVQVRIPPLAAISGKVLDEDGQPMAGVMVSASRYTSTNLGKSLMMGSTAQTDDRGEYRIFGIQPGRYLLVAIAHGGPRAEQGANVHSTVPEEGYEPVYYPGVTDLSQAPLQELQPGAEWAADFKLRHLPVYHIRGHVTGLTTRGRGNSVFAWRCEQEQLSMPLTAGAQLGARLADSRFDISGVVSGTYCVRVQGLIQTVTVKDADVDGLEWTLAPSFTVSGALTIEGTPPVLPPQLNIGLISVSAQESAQGAVKSDGSFQIENIYPGAYSIQAPQAPSLYVKSILYGSQDVTNGLIPAVQPGAALIITMGADPGEIDITVQPGNADAGVPVLIGVFPEDAYAARLDMQRLAPSSAGGALTLANIAPGIYKVFALQSEDFGDLYNLDLRKLLEAKATAVTVHASGREQVSVTAISSDELAQARGKLK